MGHLEFPIGTIVAIFDLSVIAMFPTKFRIRRKSEKYIFKMAAIATILDYRSERFLLFLIYNKKSGLQAISMLSTKFRVNCLCGSGEEAKNIFSEWPWRSSWIFEGRQNTFDSVACPDKVSILLK